jgi:lysyl-tRNA synthetase class 1
MTSNIQHLGFEVAAWPFQEARQLLQRRLRGTVPEKGYVLFETGYGPSGLPHIGTFAEVVRTTMVRRAFERLAPEIPTRLFCFSDDMDGLRKVPDNIPNKDLVAAHLGKPLTSVPDPFGTHDSFGHHNNARLRQFLDTFGFAYEFKSATECYRAGLFDQALLAVLWHYDEIRQVVLPTLGPERRATYSPFLPVSSKTGKILQVPVLVHDAKAGTIVFKDDDGTQVETVVTGGHCKLQWKCDWAMRWVALAVDYEMSGKDLIESVALSSQICRILGGTPPNTLTYEMFLDAHGEKISKSKGNGIAVEEWLQYAPLESLAFFMYQKPKAAKRLHFDVIPRNVDDYLTELQQFTAQSTKQRLNTAVWHIHNGILPQPEASVSFSMLLNLVSVCHADDPRVIWHYVTRYVPKATPETSPLLNQLVGYAIGYYKDFVRPAKHYRKATRDEKKALEDLRNVLASMPANATADDIQVQVYEVGKRHQCFGELREWFTALYQILLGQDAGPRMGSFIAVYGIGETVALLDRAIAGDELSEERHCIAEQGAAGDALKRAPEL